ncbi:MAG: hypothetical protein ACRDQA_21795 [Nocardioidaceae bacterium]
MTPDETASPARDSPDPTRQAVADLVRRLEVPAEEIDITAVEQVTWRDSSLGCPEPGHMYAQVLTPGWRIMLGHRGAVYEYHAALDGGARYCDNPQEPLPR